MTTMQSFERGYQYLNAAHGALNDGNASAAEAMARKLREYRPELGKEEFSRTHCTRHSIRERIHELPFTRRCCQQPRRISGRSGHPRLHFRSPIRSKAFPTWGAPYMSGNGIRPVLRVSARDAICWLQRWMPLRTEEYGEGPLDCAGP
jgi:hypothetical protein